MLSVFAGCAFHADPDPKEVMSRVRVGMTKDDVVDRLGPPDDNWGPVYSECSEYGFGKTNADRYAIYFNNQRRVIYSEHAACNLNRSRALGTR
ncbi:hypothetical protein BRPE64_DCDS00900 (plasmid) [Caballeronia insecticola]|uniref:Outer membrane protein assembly factor BamE domain-containing protein n=2 Tax=Caballeronia insecticola TaxID=758793 RepID=R4X301_9BURK|nr:hypothetical protein BRPE64_DCDS00900 [Caballeronia insecticola]